MNTKHPYSEQLDVQGRYEVVISYTASFIVSGPELGTYSRLSKAECSIVCAPPSALPPCPPPRALGIDFASI